MSQFNSLILRRKGLPQRQTSFSVKNDYQTVQQVGTGSNTYTRASKAYVPDFEGRIVQVQDNCPSFVGLRSVSNLLTYSEDFSNAAWVKNGTVSITGQKQINLPAVSDYVTQNIALALLPAGSVIQYSFTCSGVEGSTINFSSGGGDGEHTVTLTATPQRLSFKMTTTSAFSVFIIKRAGNTANYVIVDGVQIEIVTGATNQNPSEYVPTTSAPLTIWKDYANPFTVTDGVVTDTGVRTALPTTYLKAGVLSEPAGTNIFANPLSPATQGITVSAVQYTLSFYGTGSIVATGTASFTLNGTGANNLVTQTFTPTAGTLTLTLSGSVTSPQLETGAVATSRMLSSAATSTRGATSDLYPLTGNISVTVGTLYMEVITNSAQALQGLIGSTDGSNAVFLSPTEVAVYNGTTTVSRLATMTIGVKHKICVTWNGTAKTITVNGVQTSATQSGNILTGTNISIGNGASTNVFNGHIGQVRIYNTALSDAECIRLTS